METLKTVIGVLLIVMGIFLVISVLMQSSKNHRMSGTIAGGAETFFGKQKGKTLDAFFNKCTTVVTIIFVVLVILLYVLQPSVEDLLAQNQVVTEQTGEETEDTTNEEANVVDDAAQTDESSEEIASEENAPESAEVETETEVEAEVEA